MLRALSSRAAASLCSQAVSVCAGGSFWAQSLPAAATAVLAQQNAAFSSSSSSSSSSSAIGSRQPQQQRLQQQRLHQHVEQQQAAAAVLITPTAAACSSMQQTHHHQWPRQQQQVRLRHLLPQHHPQLLVNSNKQWGTHMQQQWQQWQQQRGLLGVAKKKNYQDHNKTKPKKYKIKTPPMARRRIVVGEDGVMWRMQAGRRHKRYKKSRERLASLKGMVPLARADAAKLKKLGFKKTWWTSIKS